MFNVLLVGIGGFIGAILRYLLSGSIYRMMEYPIFPLGIVIVNILGCLVIGFLGGLAESREALTPELRTFLFIGVLGGFTTFSSFGYDTFGLLRDGQMLFAVMNVLIQVLVGLGAVWFGFICSRFF